MLHAIKLQPKLRGLVDFSQLRLGVTGFQLCVAILPAKLPRMFLLDTHKLFFHFTFVFFEIYFWDCSESITVTFSCVRRVMFTFVLFESHQFVAMSGTHSCVTSFLTNLPRILCKKWLSLASQKLLLPRWVSFFD